MLKKRKILVAFGLIAVIMTSLFVWRPFQEKKPFLRIPIIFAYKRSCINVEIEGTKYLFELDLGCFDCFSTHKKEVIEKIKNKTPLDPVKWVDVQGNWYFSSAFSVKKMNIETFEIFNAIIQEESPSFILEGSYVAPLKNPSREKDDGFENVFGRVGVRTLRILDYWLIDFPNSSIVAIRDIEKIKQVPGFSFEGFTEVSLENIRSHIGFVVETDFGLKKFILDTGASRSIMGPPSEEYSTHQILKTNRFVVGGYDLGETALYLFQPDETFLCDGFLGQDFFQKHAIYLDFKKNRAFIGPSTPTAPTEGNGSH